MRDANGSIWPSMGEVFIYMQVATNIAILRLRGNQIPGPSCARLRSRRLGRSDADESEIIARAKKFMT